MQQYALISSLALSFSETTAVRCCWSLLLGHLGSRCPAVVRESFSERVCQVVGDFGIETIGILRCGIFVLLCVQGLGFISRGPLVSSTNIRVSYRLLQRVLHPSESLEFCLDTLRCSTALPNGWVTVFRGLAVRPCLMATTADEENTVGRLQPRSKADERVKVSRGLSLSIVTDDRFESVRAPMLCDFVRDFVCGFICGLLAPIDNHSRNETNLVFAHDGEANKQLKAQEME